MRTSGGISGSTSHSGESEGKGGGVGSIVLQSVGLFSTYWLGMIGAVGRGLREGVSSAVDVADRTREEVAELSGVSRSIRSRG